MPISRNHWDGSCSWVGNHTRRKQEMFTNEIQVPWTYAHGFLVQQRLDCHTCKLYYCRSLLYLSLQNYCIWLFFQNFWISTLILFVSKLYKLCDLIFACLCLYLINEAYLLYRNLFRLTGKRSLALISLVEHISTTMHKEKLYSGSWILAVDHTFEVED